jgi:hypothetical protein
MKPAADGHQHAGQGSESINAVIFNNFIVLLINYNGLHTDYSLIIHQTFTVNPLSVTPAVATNYQF